MNFFQISLTTKCNYNCWHCPIAAWRNNTHEKFPLNNAQLIPWIEKNVNKYFWIIELTGGEPSLYNGIDELLDWFDKNNYKVIVKTNGTGNLKHYKNIRLIAAFHNLNAPPKNYDEYLIINKVDSDEKIKYCQEHNIPYKVIGYNKEVYDDTKHGFEFSAFLNPAGHQVRCQSYITLEKMVNADIDINQYYYHELIASPICPDCKAAIDCWKFVPDEWKR